MAKTEQAAKEPEQGQTWRRKRDGRHAQIVYIPPAHFGIIEYRFLSGAGRSGRATTSSCARSTFLKQWEFAW